MLKKNCPIFNTNEYSKKIYNENLSEKNNLRENIVSDLSNIYPLSYFIKILSLNKIIEIFTDKVINFLKIDFNISIKEGNIHIIVIK